MMVAMPYALHAEVLITTIGKTGRVVSAVRGGRYRVRVGGVEVSCREEELKPAAPARRRGKGRQPSAPPMTRLSERPSKEERERLSSIDLHGATVEEALTAVEARLSLALLAGLDHLDVIHGIGTGKVRHAVHGFLRGVGAVRRFEIAPGNPGVTRVYF